MHIKGETFHGRKGGVANAFRYSVDYVCLDPSKANGPGLFSVDRFNAFSVRTSDHGGIPKSGTGLAWVREVLNARGVPTDGPVRLLTQPRVLGHVFNPVSFWLVHDPQKQLRCVIAEVTNTFGDRHSYLCRHENGRPILPSDTLEAQKIFHVSPFQPVEGRYRFRFDIREDRVGIWIDYSTAEGGVFTNLIGPRAPLSNRAILGALLRRPFGARRVLGLIHWQALKLWWKGARYRVRPEPPSREVS